MKPILLIPPVLALMLVVGWIGNERRTISTLEKESAVLKERLAARSAPSGPEAVAAKPGSPAKATKDKEPIDWKKMAAQIGEMRNSGGMGDMRAMIRFQQRVQAMSKEEIVSALDEIAGLELPTETRDMLEQMLIGPLCQKDPEFALTRYIDRMADDRGGLGWQLSNAMKEWARKDPAAATSWFDGQIAAGKFDSKSLDGRNRSRIQFEGSLIALLVSTDPTAAAARLETLPEDQRREALQANFGNTIEEKDQPAYAKLVREGLSENDQLGVIAQHASQMAWNKDYAEITGYMDRIQATPAERAACVEQAANSKISQLAQNKAVTREDIEAMREWATAQAPGTVDKLTGSALANASRGNRKLEFSEAAALALQYHEAAGNDQVLDGFLSDGVVDGHKEEARALAEKISDPKRRAEILENLK